MNGGYFELNGGSQEIIGERQRRPEENRLANLDGIFGKAGDHRLIESDTPFAGEPGQFVAFAASLIFEIDQLERSVHPGLKSRMNFDASKRLLARVLQEVEGLPRLAQLIGDMHEINGGGIGLVEGGSEFLAIPL